MRACIVNLAPSDRPEGFDQIASLIGQQGWTVDEVVVDPDELTKRRNSRAREHDAFVHTPAPLLRSWTCAQLIHEVTAGFDVVVMSDQEGLGGVFALESANRRSKTLQQVWTLAGMSDTLRLLRNGQSLATNDADLESTLDWEIVQYRSSDQVVCRSEVERELLQRVGVDAVVVTIGVGRVVGVSDPSVNIFVPGEVSRTASSPEILRAILGLPDVSVTFGSEDRSDEYWQGSTWDALDELRSMLGDRVSRLSGIPETVDLVVVGDPFATHTATMQWASDTSKPVAAPAGSVVAQQWTGVAQWSSTDELVQIIEGEDPGQISPTATSNFDSLIDRTKPANRAQRISVGIPVFGEAAFLDELISSVLFQTEPPHEVFLLVDGTPSVRFKRQVEKWTEAFGGRLTSTSQPNRGVCVARNRLLDIMSGDAILLVDQDDLLVEHTLERMSQALTSNPDHAGIACWTEFFGGYEGIEAKPPFDRRTGMRENPIVSTSVLLDRAVIDDGARFEPDLAFLYCEDWNYWAEIVSRGHSIGLVPEPLVRHRVHTDSGGFRRTDLSFEVGRDRARRKLR